jgi:serine/threonine protein kinase
VVKVLKISEHTKVPYIDYQRLDTFKKFKPKFKYIRSDIRNGLKNLHKLNIIYIDLKEDNIGYDVLEKQWKIFDFDMSGICSSSKLRWVRKPLMYWKYNSVEIFCKSNPSSHYSKKFYFEVRKLCKKKSLVRMDEIIYYIVFNDKLSI